GTAPAAATMPRAALSLLPPTHLTPELPSALLLLSPQGVLAADAPDDGTSDTALTMALIGLRRRGFRNLVAHPVLCPFPLHPSPLRPAPASPRPRRPPGAAGEPPPPWRSDADRVRGWLAILPERYLELVLAGAFAADGRGRLLLDCRGLVDRHNGTSQATLGL